ncbi:glycosyltransferase [Pseudomonas parasichuanensis]|uniref:glycosyltransferase n=1 Tax=Pseudomonas parasichuanensis TaxID=2892329 RepID=UPI001F30FF9A|nr:glycosyltransferase [Pseudomonas parasichuanensis]
MSISFIIPAYNSQASLKKCLDSILQQPYDQYEIIVVNDGSTDGTQEIIEEYLRLDGRIKTIYQENSGQGAARSNGLALARGDYVWFVDSDDWLLQSVLPRLSRLLSQIDPDVLVTNFEYVFDHQPAVPSSLVPQHLAGKVLCPTENAGDFAAISCWNTPPWRLIARRSHLIKHDITFAHGVFYEDHPFAIHLMLTAARVYVDAGITYAYYQRATSTTKTNDQKAFDFLVVRKLCLELFKRFNQYEKLAPIVAGYILPANFFSAHVATPYQQEFIERLHQDMDPEDLEFGEKHGDWSSQLFAKAVRSKDPSVIGRALDTQRIRMKYSRAGARRLIARIKKAVVHRIVGRLQSLKQFLLNPARHLGIDASGYRFLSAGAGVRVEPIYIDVRVSVENRPYVKVGDYSHVGGTFVFERGIGSVTIGERSSIGSGCKFICAQERGIHIGSNVMLSWDCTVMDSNAHSLDPDIRANDAYDWKVGVDAGRMGAYKDWSQVASAPIYIEDNVWVGFESVILKGVRIGKGSVVGARSMVTRDVAPFCVYAGSPARFVSFVPRDRWAWEEIIQAAQGDPSLEKTLIESYLHTDLMGSLRRYMATEEFTQTLNEFRQHSPHARSVLDVGGAGGVMAIAFALSGYHVTLAEPSTDEIVGVGAARKLLELAAAQIDVTVVDRVKIEPLPIELLSATELYDIVYCRQVVHHFRDPVIALKKIGTLMQDDATAFFVREHVVFDDADMEFFLANHPFHRYTGGENAYRREEYCDFIDKAGLALVKEYKFADSPINYFPHSEQTVASFDERQIAGRPYTYIVQKKKAEA